MSSPEDLNLLQNQILMLQQRFDVLERSLKFGPTPSGYNHHLFPTLPHPKPLFHFEEPPLTFELVDFSPSWDYLQGGAKLLVCVKTTSGAPYPEQTHLQLSFGAHTLVPLSHI